MNQNLILTLEKLEEVIKVNDKNVLNSVVESLLENMSFSMNYLTIIVNNKFVDENIPEEELEEIRSSYYEERNKLLDPDNFEDYISNIRKSLKRASKLDKEFKVHILKYFVNKAFKISIKFAKKTDKDSYKQMKKIWKVVKE